MKKIALILATGSLIATGAAIAQPMGETGERAPATRDAVIAKTDKAFARMDANGDGVLSEADKAARMAKRFAAMDTDGDGMLSQAEFMAAHEARAEKRAERREMRGERRGGERMGMRGMRSGRGGPEGMIKRADANGDGQVTKAEMQTAALARFDRADADSDGTISAQERKAVRAEWRGKRGEQ
ncbi:EF-hand domain-containing protein [Erythrobacter sp. SDW2]|uniref:EF-hand domain-containing protein n=1 Tax=Erythrobacter sp. SDW2 TaxID=2907154 RepID=UPI001F361D12|nr:EF-hand domain-containing protein [Erythrobacter sp. SDW2]UIP07513.1 EF-hand domain-containing protein [Erythrobacter sp. SDW2]